MKRILRASPWGALFLLVIVGCESPRPPDGAGDVDAVGTWTAPVLSSGASWTSPEADYSNALDWGDMDGDGDLDLDEVGRPGVNVVREDNTGVFTQVWASAESDTSYDIDWGDWDGATTTVMA